MDVTKFHRAAFYVGIAGDVALQWCTGRTKRGNAWGFESYFKQHGPVASVFIAGGMMVGAATMYTTLFGAPTYTGVFALGVVWDVAFRNARIMPSLDGYYASVNPLSTAVWGGLPLVMALYASLFI